MTEAATQPATSELLAVISELLDAHADTVELSVNAEGGLRWAAHLDYLRALQRTTKEFLATAWIRSEPR